MRGFCIAAAPFLLGVGRLDVDLVAGEPGGQTCVLTLLADGQTQLVGGHRHAAGLALVGQLHADHVRRRQRRGDELGGILAVLDDVDLLAPQFIHDGVDALPSGANARADGIHVGIVRPHGDLGAVARFPGDGAHLHGAVVDLRHLQLEQPLHQTGVGAGDQHLRAAGGAAHLYQIHLDHLPLVQLLAGHLLVHGQHRLGGLRAGADAEHHVAAAGIDAADGAGEDLVLLAAPLVVDHAVLGLPQTLNDDLLAVAGGDAAELHGLHGEIHHAAQLILGGDTLGGGKGFSFIPEIDEEVMIDFEGGNAERPYVKGTLYNGVGEPDSAWLSNNNSSNQVKAIRTRNGHTIEIHDEGEDGYIRIYDNEKENYILTFSTDEKLIKLESTGNIELYAKNDIIMHAGHDINASADNDIFIAASHDMQRTADNDICEHAGNDRSTSIDRNDSLTVESNQFVRVNDNKDEQVAHKLQVTAENIRIEATENLLEYSNVHQQKANDSMAMNSGNRIDIKSGVVKVQ